MEKKLEEMSEVEIKAIMYDQICIMEQARKNIDALQRALFDKTKNNAGTPAIVE